MKFRVIFIHFSRVIGSLKIIKIAGNDTELDRHEIKRIFTVNTNEYNNSNAQATGIKFRMSFHFITAHLKIKNYL